MKAGCNNSELRDDILKVGRKLFQSQGYDNTTLEDIVQELQIQEQHLRELFQSKDDLLEAIWSEK